MDTQSYFQDGPLDHALVAEVASGWKEDPRLGAVASFAGVVRGDHVGDGEVVAIEFSAHREMAEKAIGELIARLTQRVSSETVRVYLRHALGVVSRGEVPIVIVVGTSHRREAFELCSGLLEALKEEVPIYGKELTDSGGHSWKVNR